MFAVTLLSLCSNKPMRAKQTGADVKGSLKHVVSQSLYLSSHYTQVAFAHEVINRNFCTDRGDSVPACWDSDMWA